MESEQARIVGNIIIIVLRRLDLRFASGSVNVQHQVKETLHLFLILTQARLCPHVRRCVRFCRGMWGVDTPAGEHAAFGAFSRHFRPDIAVRKLYKIKPAIGLTGRHPQSPATRVFLSYAGCYRFREIAGFPLSIYPQTPLYQRFYRYLLWNSKKETASHPSP